jgi:hypothetical protein
MFPRSYQQGYGGFSFQINVLPLCSIRMTTAKYQGENRRDENWRVITTVCPVDIAADA